MNRARYRWLLRAALVLVGGLALLVWAVGRQAGHRLTVENHSGQPIAVLRLTVAGESKTFENVKEGAGVAAPFPISGAEAVAVEGKLADGTVIRYRRAQAGEQVNLLVLPGGQIAPRKGGGG
jgi:hypothetical protein